MFFIGPEIKSTGRAEFTHEDGRKVLTVGTVNCSHCGRLWHISPGSKRRIGTCSGCKTNKSGGFICGRKECETCNGGVDQLLDNLERGMPWHEAMQFRPVFVPFND